MEYFQLTTPQQNIWNLQKFYEDTAISNLCGAIFFKEKRSSELLQQAICQFIQSQSGIRLRFCESGEPKQYVTDMDAGDIPVRKFVSMEEFDCYAKAFAKIPIGLVNCPMYRFVVFDIAGESGILVVLSHMVSDAWTFGLMANQVEEAYQKLLEKNGETIARADYRDFIQVESDYFQSERYKKDKDYWEAKYAVCPEASRIKLCQVQAGSVEARRVTRALPKALEEKVRVFCKTHSVTEAVLFEAALLIYLARINQENQTVTIGVPVLNRCNAKEKRIAGMFISTMPLTVTMGEELTTGELTAQITKGHMEIFRHQKYPYSDLLKRLRENYGYIGNLYDVMISYQNAKTDTGADTKWYSNGYSEVPFVLHIDNRDAKDTHTFNVDYQTTIFSKDEVICILERLEYILEQVLENEDALIKEISIVPKQELEKVINDFNDTYVDYPRDKCVHELFAEQAARTPEKVALVFESKKFTYRQLDEMSNSLAHFLRGKGVGANDVIPIIAKRSWHMVVAMLGVLKAGGAYMPVSPDYPMDRIANMLEIAKSKLALLYGYEGALSVESVDLAEADYVGNIQRIANVNQSEDAAYVIFTSGSTGEPKGITISHKNLTNFTNYNEKNMYQHLAIRNGKVILASTVFTFDISVFEIYMALLNGLMVVLTNEWESVSPNAMANLIKKNAIDILHFTPTKMQIFLKDLVFCQALIDVKIIMLGAEELPCEICTRISKFSKADIFNGYGPTEITIGASFKLICTSDITIGTPIANTQVYILDINNSPLPIGVAGELCIAGEGVGKGYLNRPELTAERFAPNPFATEENKHGKIMYRTGDLARWRTDGEIEYLGRIDTQVKIRGLRIELGEIESVMSTMEGVGLVAVADKRDEGNRQYLVGYYTTDTDIDEGQLRRHLSAKLPQYMIPNYFMRLEEMPMTSSGKTDRKNLPVPEMTGYVQEYVAPVTELQGKLCSLWEEVLQHKPIGIQENFFDIGGDSLTAIEFVAKAYNRGVDIALQTVFDYPTVQSLCEYLEKGRMDRVQYTASDFEKYQPLFAENVITENFEPKKKKLGNILLTGATGFLGAHVLRELLQQETGKIYCLVRSRDKDDRRGRLSETLQYYFGDEVQQEPDRRIIPVVGDVERAELADHMPVDVQTVIHTAASVKHYGSYEYFRKVNVEGTRHVVNYAKSMGAKLIHISTLSVSGNSMVDDFAVYRSAEEKQFDETSLYIGQPLDNVYIRSKFEAEKVVYDAMLEGLEAKVIRVGNLTNRASDYKFQPNYVQNAFLTRMKALLEFGVFPDYLMPLYAEFSPVELTAQGIVKIAQYAGRQNVFHLYSNRPLYFERFGEILSQLKIPMEVVDGDAFKKALQETLQNGGTEYIFEAFQNDMDEQGRLVYDSNIRIFNDFTMWFLSKVGFAWNEIDVDYIKGYVEYFRAIGYLKV